MFMSVLAYSKPILNYRYTMLCRLGSWLNQNSAQI